MALRSLTQTPAPTIPPSVQFPPGAPSATPGVLNTQPTTGAGFDPGASTGGASPVVASVWGISADEQNVPVQGQSMVGWNGPHNYPSTVQAQLQNYYKMSPADLANLQQAMYAAGPDVFYSSSYYTTNGPRPKFGEATDDESYAAYRKAIILAARTNSSVYDVVIPAAQLAQQNGTAPKQTESQYGLGKFTVPLTNEADVAVEVNKVSQAIMGQNATPDQIAAITAILHNQEITGSTQEANAYQAQQQAYLNAQTGQGGTPGAAQPIQYQKAATPGDVATQYFQQNDAGQVNLTRTLEGYSLLKTLIGGGAGVAGAAKPQAV